MGVKGYADLTALPEDDRITVIARAARAGQRVAIGLDDDKIKIARYIAKIEKLGARHISTVPFVEGAVIVSFGPIEQ